MGMMALAAGGDVSIGDVMTSLVGGSRPAGVEQMVRDALAAGPAAWRGAAAVERALAIGFTRAQARRLILCATLADLLARDSWSMPAPITGPADVLAHVNDIRAGTREQVVALYLDARNRPIHREVVAVGGLRSSVIQPRDVLGPALTLPAAALVLVHNHPSGDCTPSREDIEVTRQLAAAAKLLGLELLDHLVVSARRCASLRELGHL
ncbi:MAG: JAB domain-containing protein [Candidatus Dormibacteria bacterium]